MTPVAPRLVPRTLRKLGPMMLAIGSVSAALAVFASGALASSDANFAVNGGLSFSAPANQTTAHFTFSGSKQPSDIRVLPCSTSDALATDGPSGTKSSSTGFGGSGQTGVKFQPGAFGSYTVAFSGHVFRVEVVVVSGKQHSVFGLGNPTCAPAAIPTTSSTAPTTTTTLKAASVPGSGSSSGPAVNVVTPAAGGPVVAGAQAARAGVEPAVAGTALAHTGRHTRTLMVFAGLALALGGLFLMAGGGDSRVALATVKVRR